jgi:hypothetical protein
MNRATVRAHIWRMLRGIVTNGSTGRAALDQISAARVDQATLAEQVRQLSETTRNRIPLDRTASGPPRSPRR